MTNLPKKYFASARGQVLILFLLILVLAMSIVVSISSRTVTEIEVTTTSDDSNKAYFAAEAGVEEALEHYKTTVPSPGATIHLSFDNAASATTTVSTGGVRDNFVYPNLVDRDDVAQVMMLNDPNNLNSGWCPPPAAAGNCIVTIYWGTDPAGANSNKQAIEVSVVFIDSAGVWQITKFAVSAGPPPFCSVGAQIVPVGPERTRTDSVSGVTFTFFYKTDINLRFTLPASPISGCAVANQGGTVGNGQIVLMRIRPLFNLQAIPVAVSSDSPQIPNQGVTLESVGSTTSGVTRKIEVTTLYPAMPAIFDYVLFNGGTSPLTK